MKFAVEHGPARALFDLGIEHAPGRAPFSLGLKPREGRALEDLLAVGMAPRGSGVLGSWDGRTSLFISHLHLDHSALVRWVDAEVPVYYPAEMEDLRLACVRSGYQRWREQPGTPVSDRGRVSVGEIEVEFVAVDHDLPGAAGFVIRTPDLVLAYTGDHRWHGLHPELTAAFAEAARGADVLILESVSLGFGGSGGTEYPHPQLALSEKEVAHRFEAVLARTAGLVVLTVYPMNRERVHALGEACARSGRRLLLQPQAAEMAAWPHQVDDVEAVRRQPAGHCVQLGFEDLPRLIDLEPPEGSVYVHSNGTPMGSFEPGFAVMGSWLQVFGLEFVSLGSSGHSRPEDLVRMVQLVQPGLVVPVHSRRPEALDVPGFPCLLPEALRPYVAPELRAAGRRVFEPGAYTGS